MKREVNIKLNGVTGIAVVVIVAVLIGIRFLTLSNIHDSNLTEKVQLSLDSKHLGAMRKAIRDSLDSEDVSEMENAAEMSQQWRVDINTIKGSTPLLEFGTTQNYVLKVNYEVVEPGGKRTDKIKYYNAIHRSLSGNWTLSGRRASAYKYYSNFF